ncbi:MAG: hypothetical protein V8T45_01570 [Oscillospiraceae bacterium]
MVNKIHESDDNTMTLLESGKIQYIISTSAKGPPAHPGQRKNPAQGCGTGHRLPNLYRYRKRFG